MFKYSGLRICSCAHRSFAEIPQIKWATVSDLLRSLMTKERPWANCSGCSWQMSDREQFPQVAHDKWANERFAQNNLTKIIFYGMFYTHFIYVFWFKKTSNSLIPSFLIFDVSKSLRSLTKNERCERIPQVTHQKWATMSKSLRLLTKNERMSELLVFLSESLIRSFFRKKTSDSLRKPMSEFPTLGRINISLQPFVLA